MRTKILFIVGFLGWLSGWQVTAQNVPKINGRIQYDMEILKRQNSDETFIGNEFRRVHLSATGFLHNEEKFKYKIEVNFAHGSLGFRDVYIEWLGGLYGKLALGSKAEPTGLDIGTSSKYIPMAERAMLTALQDFRWGAGIHYANSFFGGKMGIQLALTNKGTNDEGFVDKQFGEGANMVGRIYAVPLFDVENRIFVHLGMNYASRPYKDLKFRPENHMGDKYHFVFPGGERRFETGFEGAIVYKPFSFQAEYKTRRVANNLNKDYNVTGYYALASVFLTGETRPYKGGSFRRVIPKQSLGGGGIGAVELVFRYSVMDFSNDVIDANPTMPGQIINTGIGLNWYLNSHMRLMYNFIITDDAHQDGKLNAHLLRFALNF
jgi:phosphate-selective porin OprO/OprP